jgi:hypothetical protein
VAVQRIAVRDEPREEPQQVAEHVGRMIVEAAA